MEPTELDEMIKRTQADHVRLHEIWLDLNRSDAKEDAPVHMAILSVATTTVSAHLDALYAVRILLEQDAPDAKGA